jgi:hypothetical protein
MSSSARGRSRAQAGEGSDTPPARTAAMAISWRERNRNRHDFRIAPEKVGIRVGCRRSQIGGSDVSFSLVLIDCITRFHAVATVAQNSIGVAQN